MRAGLLTSLGFGHVSALVCIAHPAAFLHALPAERRGAWLEAQRARRQTAGSRLARVMTGKEPFYQKAPDRRFAAPDGSAAQRREEAAMLFDPSARFDPAAGVFTGGRA
jgi:fatty acid synthase